MMQKQQDSARKVSKLVLNKETVCNLKIKSNLQAGARAISRVPSVICTATATQPATKMRMSVEVREAIAVGRTARAKGSRRVWLFRLL